MFTVFSQLSAGRIRLNASRLSYCTYTYVLYTYALMSFAIWKNRHPRQWSLLLFWL